MTMKERMIDGFKNVVIARYERAGKNLSPNDADNIWYALLGVFERDGYERMREYALFCKLQ